jgi:uncharacterized protein with PIN domain
VGPRADKLPCLSVNCPFCNEAVLEPNKENVAPRVKLRTPDESESETYRYYQASFCNKFYFLGVLYALPQHFFS